MEDLDAMADVSHHLEDVRGKKGTNWRHLGKAYNILNNKLDAMTTLDSDQPHSPTEALFRHLEASQPALRVQDLVWALYRIHREDVNRVLQDYFTGQLNFVSNLVSDYQ